MVARPHVGVLALQGDVREHLVALESAGARATTVRRADELAVVDALVIPGGESTTIGKLAVAFDLLEPLRERVAAGVPAFGSCAGMVLLADAVVDGIADQPLIGGLDIVVRRNAFGRQVQSFEADLDWLGLDELVHAVFIRAPWVESMGSGVQVLAEAAGHPVAVAQGSLLATAFHPELSGDERVHAHFVQLVRAC